MSQPEQPAGLDETLLDEGRTRRDPPRAGPELDETLLDEGRSRPGTADGDWPGDGLPAPLAARYEMVRRLAAGGRAPLYLVRVRAGGAEAVVKRHLPARVPDPGLVAYLAGTPLNAVRHLEFEAGHSVMAFVPGQNLREERRAHPGDGLTALTDLVQRVAAALTALHRAGFVHRDVKPANIMIAGDDATLVDFGVAGPLAATDWPQRINLAYQPPEWCNGGLVGAATDWWGLGMTVLELATGEHPFDGLADDDIRGHFAQMRSVDVSGVPDERLRNLCRGLLATDRSLRWGAGEVGQWLTGTADPLPPEPVPSAPAAAPDVAGVPHHFRGMSFHLRAELAQEMATAWNHAVRVLFERDGGLDGLRTWLDQFTGGDADEARREVDAVAAESGLPGDVRLLRVLRALDPTRPPVYRNHVITRAGLLMTAHAAMRNDGDHGSVLRDLWNHRLLPEFDTALPDGDGSGGQALADLDRAWMRVHRDWPAMVRRVGDPDAERYLRERVDVRERLAIWLRMALDQPADRAALREELDRRVAELPVPVPWMRRLAGDPEMLWPAVLLIGHARAVARSEHDRAEAELRRRSDLALSAAFREWSRRQNRPAALGWAVAGVSLLGVAWIAVVTGADAAGHAGDPVIALAWVAAAVCLAVSLVTECLLAAGVGGRFHRRYSIPGAGVIALGPAGRFLRRSWAPGLLAVLAGLAVLGLAASRFPQYLVIATTIAHLVWAGRRWTAWRAEVAADEELIAEAERRRDTEEGVGG
ncbi:protein kinase domain-containing protein [Actinoplanes siamensis]|uniref:Protein kinase domain-containing protein n=1 Tax=Actinoplanes siamensis TaxID=1223317 RepID=A0A919N9N3_9ACTN|nr:protein kinase [Actinoplanes siamensis]GIF06856.1 hypothetical protein Asi03nite_43940 [Actinoplanes siamensis]